MLTKAALRPFSRCSHARALPGYQGQSPAEPVTVQYIPAPVPRPGLAPLLFLFGICEMDASVVSSSDAMDEAFWSADARP